MDSTPSIPSDSSQYVPFDAFVQQFHSGHAAIESNLVPTAPEFVPHQHDGPQLQPKENHHSQGAVRKTDGGGPRNGYHRRGGYGGRNSNHQQQQRNSYQHGGERVNRGQRYRQQDDFHNRWSHHDEDQSRRQYEERRQHQQQQQQPNEHEDRRNQQQEVRRRPERNQNESGQGESRRWSGKKQQQQQQQHQGKPFRSRPPPKETKCQREKLIREITSNTLECLVCCERIKDYQGTWSCTVCFHILHLKCVTKWALSSKSDDGYWRCPACQGPKTSVPRDYYCFCGKQRNPGQNRVDTAHSCGEVCAAACENGHKCTMLCHPGPHPACQATIKRACHCGKTEKLLQCSQRDEVKCTSPCSKPLTCQLHFCDQPCHAGDCSPCIHTAELVCHCAKQRKTVPCNIENRPFSCDAECDKFLDCGNHKCEATCHEGTCSPCKLLPEAITSCPCGKQAVLRGERKTCLDEIPTCKGVCKKPLRCGQPGQPHTCTGKCHIGECTPCNKKTMVKCRCGNMNQEIKCKQLTSRADDARCKKKCAKTKNCSRHKCQELCCIDLDHICKQTCNKSLSCGRHKCTLPCHRPPCFPCDRVSFDELTCECGAAVIYPPIPCGTKRPECTKPCSRSHPCDHEVLHPCHTDQRCPPCVIFTTKSCYGGHEQRKTIPCHEASFCCGLPCNKPLPCDHNCNKVCHTGECVTDACRQKCPKPRLDCVHACNQPCHPGRDCPDTNCRESVEVQCACGNLKKMRSCSDFTSEFRRFANAQLASTMAEMQNGNAISLNDILAGSGSKSAKTTKVLDCNEECRLIERNKRLEMALGPIDPTKVAMPTYTDFLKTFYRKEQQLVKNVHDKLTDLVKLAKESKQKSRSHSFPVMNREKRQMIHEMCEAFGISSQSYDAEPNRNVVATAYRDMCYCPSMSVMEVIQRETGQLRVRLPVSQNAWKSPK